MSQLLNYALTYYGVKEIAGDENNPVIMEMFKTIGQDWVEDDETSWCSAFINHCAYNCGLEYSEKLTARSWLKCGYGVDITEVKLGDVVVLWREHPKSWKGHVGIYVNQIDDIVYLLGGNQSNSVKISGYAKSRVIGVRVLEDEILPF